jgi:hypothetical protein
MVTSIWLPTVITYLGLRRAMRLAREIPNAPLWEITATGEAGPVVGGILYSGMNIVS